MFPLSDSIKARKFPFINLLLIAITVFVFLQQVLSPNIEEFVGQFALIPANINFSDYNTLSPFVTAIFLHGGFLHILSNMWFLWIFGDNVEAALGSFLFFILYFFAGVIGNFAQYLLMPNSSIPMLGASGAVAGVLGAYFILFPYAKIKTLVILFAFITVAEIPAPFMLGYWFVLQLISGAAALPFSMNTGGIAFWAHIGGFIAGVIIAKFVGSRKNTIYYQDSYYD